MASRVFPLLTGQFSDGPGSSPRRRHSPDRGWHPENSPSPLTVPCPRVSLMLIASAILLVGSSVFGFLNKTKLAERQAEIASAKASSVQRPERRGQGQGRAEEGRGGQGRGRVHGDHLAGAGRHGHHGGFQPQGPGRHGQRQHQGQAGGGRRAQHEAGRRHPAAGHDPAARRERGTHQAKAQLAELQVIKDGLESQVKTAQSQAQQAAERRVALRENGDAKNGLQGRVLAVDRNWNFVVLNLGGTQRGQRQRRRWSSGAAAAWSAGCASRRWSPRSPSRTSCRIPSPQASACRRATPWFHAGAASRAKRSI